MYISTRDNYPSMSASEVIKLGMVPAGGLFVPAEIPVLSGEEILARQGGDYQETANWLLSLFLPDFTSAEISTCVGQAYNEENFAHPQIAPLNHFDEHIYFLELWHGPTAAFKDLALQLMPHLLSRALFKTHTEQETVILVATSGDTGKAALEGFKNVQGIKIIVFYPQGGVSKVQELQMTTTDGANTYVVAVKGNFDDCQNAVKAVFADSDLSSALAKKGYALSSANSINWGRLLPQVVYYFQSYLTLIAQGAVSPGEKINFVVPTGNFGNILAGWYAYRMGLPVHKLICASNENKILTEFFHTGSYDLHREFKQTSSPSMDILVSSNLERFLFEKTGRDAAKINRWMADLQAKGCFAVDTGTLKSIENILAAGYATEEETLKAINEVFTGHAYLLDTHTAVGYRVYQKYRQQTGDQTKTVINATANPFKFSRSVLKAIQGQDFLQGTDEFSILQALSAASRVAVHPALCDLQVKEVLHHTVCEKEEIGQEIKKILQCDF